LKSHIYTLQLFIPLFANIADMSRIGTQAKRLLQMSLYSVTHLATSCMIYGCYDIHDNDKMILLHSVIRFSTASS